MELRSNQIEHWIPAATALGARPVRMAGFVAGWILVFGCTTSLAEDISREQVKVIPNEPTKASYEWQEAGRPSVLCTGSSCSRYYASSASGIDGAAGTILRLQRSDLTIVIAQCEAQSNVLPGKAQSVGTQDANASQAPQHCKMPDANSTVAAEFHTGEVKVYMRVSGYDGPGDVINETYSIRGVLQPTSTPDAAEQPSGSDVSAYSFAGDAAKPPQPDVKGDGNPAVAKASPETAGMQATPTKNGPARHQTHNDYQSGADLLTYLSHELIDPKRVNLSQWKEAQEKLVHPALDDAPPVSVQSSAEPEPLPSVPEQAPLAPGQTNTALVPVSSVTGPELSAPESLPSAPQQDPLAPGQMNTALAQAPTASEIRLSAPEPVPSALEQQPLAQGQIDTALRKAPSAPRVNFPAPAQIAPEAGSLPSVQAQSSSGQNSAPPMQERTPANKEPAAPAQAQAAPPANEEPHVQARIDSGAYPTTPSASQVASAPESIPNAMTPAASAPDPIAPAQRQSAPVRETVPSARIEIASTSGPASSSMTPVASAPDPIAPAQRQSASARGTVPSARIEVASTSEPAPSAMTPVASAPDPIAPAQGQFAPARETVPSTRIEIASASEPIPNATTPVAQTPDPIAPVQRQPAQTRETVPSAASQNTPALGSASRTVTQITPSEGSSPIPVIQVAAASNQVPPMVSQSSPSLGSGSPPVVQVNPAPRPVAPAQGTLISKEAPVPPDTRLIASTGGAAPSTAGAIAPAPSSVPPSGDADSSMAPSTSFTPALRVVSRRLTESDYSVQELGDQWGQFQRDCPEPTTDAVCLDGKRQVIKTMLRVLKAKMILIDQKMSILEAGPQDEFAQQEEDDTRKDREKLETALQRFPAVLADLDRSLVELRK